MSFYNITLDFGNDQLLGEIVSCSCPHFQRTKGCCKHIALVVKDKNPIKFKRVAAAWNAALETPVRDDEIAPTNIAVKIASASKNKIRRHTTGILAELKEIHSKTQISDEDKDLIDSIQALYDKIASMGIAEDLSRKRKRQQPAKK